MVKYRENKNYGKNATNVKFFACKYWPSILGVWSAF